MQVPDVKTAAKSTATDCFWAVLDNLIESQNWVQLGESGRCKQKTAHHQKYLNRHAGIVVQPADYAGCGQLHHVRHGTVSGQVVPDDQRASQAFEGVDAVDMRRNTRTFRCHSRQNF